MVERLIDIATGPLLRFALLVMVLGLARVFVLAVWEMVSAHRRAGDPTLSWSFVFHRLRMWTTPRRPLHRPERAAYNGASAIFHAGILIVPLFFLGHVALWQEAFGVSLPALPDWAADVLSLLAAAAVVWLIVARAAMPSVVQLSRGSDRALLVLVLAVLLTGMAAAHPAWSPLAGRTMYLLHVLTGELLLVIAPFSKLQHIVLFWTMPASSELGWRFARGTGDRVRLQLGREGQGI